MRPLLLALLLAPAAPAQEVTLRGTLEPGDRTRNGRYADVVGWPVDAGQHLYVRLLALTTAGLDLEVYPPSHQRLYTGVDDCESSGGLVKACYLDGAPDEGDWQFLVLQRDHAPARRIDYMLEVYTPYAASQTATEWIHRDAPLRPLLPDDRSRSARNHAVYLERGSGLTAGMSSDAFDPYLRLEAGIDGIGEPLAVDDDSGPGTDARLTYTATETGYYKLVAGAARADAEPGRYELDIQIEPRSGPISRLRIEPRPDPPAAPRPTPRPAPEPPRPPAQTEGERFVAAVNRALSARSLRTFRGSRLPDEDVGNLTVYASTLRLPASTYSELSCVEPSGSCRLSWGLGTYATPDGLDRRYTEIAGWLDRARLVGGPYAATVDDSFAPAGLFVELRPRDGGGPWLHLTLAYAAGANQISLSVNED